MRGGAILTMSASSWEKADDLGAGLWHKRKIAAAETPEALAGRCRAPKSGKTSSDRLLQFSVRDDKSLQPGEQREFREDTGEGIFSKNPECAPGDLDRRNHWK